MALTYKSGGYDDRSNILGEYKEEYALGDYMARSETEQLNHGGRGGAESFKVIGFYSDGRPKTDASYQFGWGGGSTVEAAPEEATGAASGGTATAYGGGASGYSAPAVVEPEPYKLNTTTGSSIGGDISATLGSVGKSPYDTAAKGLKGLTTPTSRATPDIDKELERKRFGQGLFNVGLTKPGSGTGVQV